MGRYVDVCLHFHHHYQSPLFSALAVFSTWKPANHTLSPLLELKYTSKEKASTAGIEKAAEESSLAGQSCHQTILGAVWKGGWKWKDRPDLLSVTVHGGHINTKLGHDPLTLYIYRQSSLFLPTLFF
ncbi:hypothetical protein MUK42_36311 [Musa troglodytarum]|uniref:Uncharacterized protein n=1 Tax=Musa troglodytarum TaxID=320322 RepID=A0A9E7E8P3_9LILI|nr:hypothetical protein MUK42_36311 [Musa troglodytarum]